MPNKGPYSDTEPTSWISGAAWTLPVFTVRLRWKRLPSRLSIEVSIASIVVVLLSFLE